MAAARESSVALPLFGQASTRKEDGRSRVRGVRSHGRVLRCRATHALFTNLMPLLSPLRIF